MLCKQFLRSCTQTTWGNMFRHEVLSKDLVLVQMAVKYFNATMTNLVKVRWKIIHWPNLSKRFLLCTVAICFFLCSQDSLRRTTARLVNMPVWTLTAMKTSTLSFIVSRLRISCRACIGIGSMLVITSIIFLSQLFGLSRAMLFVIVARLLLSKPSGLLENGYNIRSTPPSTLETLCVSLNFSHCWMFSVKPCPLGNCCDGHRALELFARTSQPVSVVIWNG